jgi:hypothetical protein
MKETKMRARKELLSSAGRGVIMATIAVLAVTMGEPPLAIAGPAAPASKGVSATTGSSDATDFSAAVVVVITTVEATLRDSLSLEWH